MNTIQDIQGNSAATSVVAATKAAPQPATVPGNGPASQVQATDTVTISSAGKAASEATDKTVAAPATNTGTTNSAGKIPPQPQQQTAVQMAQDSPAQLAQLAAGGNTLAKHILAERAAANKLVAPPVTAK